MIWERMRYAAVPTIAALSRSKRLVVPKSPPLDSGEVKMKISTKGMNTNEKFRHVLYTASLRKKRGIVENKYN
jgi:hypothetical protein